MGNGCSRLIALVFAAIAIIACPLAVWVGAGVATMLNPDTYITGLGSQNIYSELVPTVLTSFANDRTPANQEPAAQQLARIVQALDPDELRAITNELIPPDWLQAQTEQGIDALFGWLNGERATLEAAFDLSEVLARLTGEEAQRAAAAIVQSAPPCTQEQVGQLRAWRQGEIEAPPICQPPPLQVRPLTNWLEGFFAEIAGSIERSQVSIPQLLNARGGAGLRNVRLQITILQQLIGLFYLFPAALLALIVTIRVRSLQGFSRWMGWTGIFSGLVGLVPLLLVPLATLDGLLSLSNSLETNPLETSLTAGFYYSILTQFGGLVLVQAAALLVIGFILLAISMLIQPPLELEITPGSTASAHRKVSVPASSPENKR